MEFSTSNLTARQLLQAADLDACACASSDFPITAITDDSRQVVPGSCFVAVPGAKAHGNEFVGLAVQSGASMIVLQSDVPVPSSVKKVLVSDARGAAANLAAAFYGLRGHGCKCPRLVGITGTNGKTTIAWMLRAVLRAAGRSTGLLGTIEYDLLTERRKAPLTTPGPMDLCRMIAAMREAGATDVVMEVSSHALEQRRTDGLQFAAGVFTNLTGDHLDYHQTMEAYASAKRRMFANLDAQAFAVVNADDGYASSMIDRSLAKVIRYGLDAESCDVKGRNVSLCSQGLSVRVIGKRWESLMRCALVGRHNVLNVLAVAATADALGVPESVIRDGLESMSGVPGRLQRVEPDGHPFSVYVDYAHTDDALRNVLTAIRSLTKGQLICVFGCGGDRDRTKRPRMAAVVGSLADVALVTSDNPRTEDPTAIIKDILPGFGSASSCRVAIEPDRRSAIESAIAAARKGDTVLIAGKGHEDYQLIGGQVMEFDDATVARECLQSKVVDIARDQRASMATR